MTEYKQLEHDILLTIVKTFPFSYEQVKQAYKLLDSWDGVIALCQASAAAGLSSLTFTDPEDTKADREIVKPSEIYLSASRVIPVDRLETFALGRDVLLRLTKEEVLSQAIQKLLSYEKGDNFFVSISFTESPSAIPKAIQLRMGIVARWVNVNSNGEQNE